MSSIYFLNAVQDTLRSNSNNRDTCFVPLKAPSITSEKYALSFPD